jgi:ribonuclease BN (tRNA processing enzyme)
VRKLLLSHLYPVDVSDEERLNECRKVYKGDVSLAEDLMEIDINIPAC